MPYSKEQIKEIRKEFDYNESYVNLNHGSFGWAPKSVVQSQIKSLYTELSAPDEYVKRNIPELNRSRRESVAKILDTDVDNLVFVVNATTAANAIIRSYPFELGDVIVHFDTIYGSCKNLLSFMAEKYDLKVVSVPIEFPIDREKLVSDFEATIVESKARLAFFDSVSSMPSALMPWERLCEICRKNSVLSYVDGAHGIGLIPISLRNARPDFFATNLHKWLGVNHSVAALYVDPALQRKINTLPISAVYVPENASLDPETEKALLGLQFDYVGTAHHAAVDSIADSIKFRESKCGGEQAIQDQQAYLAERAVDIISTKLKVKEMTDGSGKRIGMAMFEFPLQPESPDEAQRLMAFVLKHFLDMKKTYIPLCYHRGVVCFRVSMPYYLLEEELHYCVTAIEEAIESWNRAQA